MNADFSGLCYGDTPADIIMISDITYDNMLQDIMARPEKKRKQWKSYLTDKYGQNTRLIWKDNKLMNYCVDTKLFGEVIPHRKYLIAVKLSKDAKLRSKEAILCMKGFDVGEIIRKSAEENHTGNHEGRVNHTIKVKSPNLW